MEHAGIKEYRDAGALRRHPIACAVALALAGASLLGGCASGGPLKGNEVAQAKEAFARQDYAAAARILAEPAMKGDPEAQYALGYMYYYGQGVPQDIYRARSWMEHSAALGYGDAKRALALLVTYAKIPSAQEKGADGGLPSLAPSPPQGRSSSSPAAAPAAKPPATPVSAAEPAPGASAVSQCPPVTANASLPAPPAPARVGVTATQAETVSAPLPPAAKATPAAESEAPVVPPSPVVPSSAPSMPGPAMSPSAPAIPDEEATTAVAPVTPATVYARSLGPSEHPRFTLHLMSSTKKEDLSRLVQAYGLGHAVGYYQVDQRDGTHYRLIFGGFDTVAEAQAALSALPEALSKTRPWVNNYPGSQLLVMRFDDGVQMARR